jgi:hypothetical protein
VGGEDADIGLISPVVADYAGGCLGGADEAHAREDRVVREAREKGSLDVEAILEEEDGGFPARDGGGD